MQWRSWATETSPIPLGSSENPADTSEGRRWKLQPAQQQTKIRNLFPNLGMGKQERTSPRWSLPSTEGMVGTVFSNISKRSSLITCIAPESISGPALRTIHTFDFLSRAWVLGSAERKLVKFAVKVNTSNPACVIYLTNRGKMHK